MLPRCVGTRFLIRGLGVLNIEISGDLDPEMYISADTRRSRSTESGEGLGFSTGLILYYVA